MGKPKSLYLVDGSSFIFRAYHAIRYLSSAAGVPTNAVYGFGGMLLKLLTDKKPDLLAVVFDAKGPTFRHEIYEDYKANRPPPPEDLIPQFALIRELVAALGVESLEREGVEADDIIATLALQAQARGLHTVVVSSDKDLMVLAGETIQLYDSMKDKVYTPQAVVEKFGVKPDQLQDLLALMGDTSDNIPGVPGVGKKTGATLIRQYGCLDAVLEAAKKGEIKGKRGEKLVAHAADARLARKLIALKHDVALEVELDELAAGPAEAQKLETLLERLDFKRWLADLEKIYSVYGKKDGPTQGTVTVPDPAPKPSAKRDVRPTGEVKDGPQQKDVAGLEAETPSPQGYRAVRKEAELREVIAALRRCGRFAVDLETTGLDPTRAAIVGVAVAVAAGRAWYIPVGHTTLQDRAQQLDMKSVLAALKPLLEDKNIVKYGQNYKYDYVLFRRHGVEMCGVGCDPMIASYLLDPSQSSHGLSALAERELGYRMLSFAEVCGKGRGSVTFDQVSVSSATRYAAEDAELTYILARRLQRRVAQENLESLLRDVEIPLGRVLGIMELNGILLDRALFAKVSARMAKRLVALEKEVAAVGGMEVNINSPKQLQVLLFEKLGLKPVRKTKTGYSTDAEVLETLQSQHPVAALILEYRMLSKLRSTYTEALPKLINPATGRIHTSYNQAVAATGRLSSSDPNLQNIPVRTEIGREIRKAFVAPAGALLISADYSQIELRVLAHLSEDPKLLEAFRAGADVHRQTAAEVFDVAPSAVDAEMRRVAKAVNFGTIYGQGAFGLSRQLHISRDKASAYIEQYFKRYSGVARYMEQLIEEGRCSGRVTTLLGRRRPLIGLRGQSHRQRAAAERIARNTPIQGSAADIIKLAMLRCQARLERDFPHAAMLLTVHDELIFEAPTEMAEDLAAAMTHEMENIYPLAVPLKVDVGMGQNWEAAH